MTTITNRYVYICSTIALIGLTTIPALSKSETAQLEQNSKLHTESTLHDSVPAHVSSTRPWQNSGTTAFDLSETAICDTASNQSIATKNIDELFAEYLSRNPDICLWEFDVTKQCYSILKIPDAPAEAIKLPPTNGVNDTSQIQDLISEGGDFVGDGSVYFLDNLQITAPTRIWNMPSSPTTSAWRIAEIRSEDVQIYHSPVNGNQLGTFSSGWSVRDGSHRFTLVKSGVRNIKNTSTNHAYGVHGEGIDDVHVACNEFSNLISTNTPVRALWLVTGKTSTGILRGGAFANNFGKNMQSGNLNKDADVVVLQGHKDKTVKDRPFLIMANRFEDAGKRFVKWQTGNSKALSNFYHWKSLMGPLGERSMSEAFASFTSNISAKHNRIKYSVKNGVPKTMFAMLGGSIEDKPYNNHFNGNIVEYASPVSTKYSSTLFVGRNFTAEDESGYEFGESSFTDNTLLGPGAPMHIFWFRDGWNSKGANFEHSPNSINKSAVVDVYR